MSANPSRLVLASLGRISKRPSSLVRPDTSSIHPFIQPENSLSLVSQAKLTKGSLDAHWPQGPPCNQGSMYHCPLFSLLLLSGGFVMMLFCLATWTTSPPHPQLDPRRANWWKGHCQWRRCGYRLTIPWILHLFLLLSLPSDWKILVLWRQLQPSCYFAPRVPRWTSDLPELLAGRVNTGPSVLHFH